MEYLRLSYFFTEQFWRKTEAEFIHPDFKTFSSKKMPEFVDYNQNH